MKSLHFTVETHLIPKINISHIVLRQIFLKKLRNNNLSELLYLKKKKITKMKFLLTT